MAKLTEENVHLIKELFEKSLTTIFRKEFEANKANKK